MKLDIKHFNPVQNCIFFNEICFQKFKFNLKIKIIYIISNQNN